MINKIVISDIYEALSRVFLERKEINYVISFLNPVDDIVLDFYKFYKDINNTIQWDYFTFYDIETESAEIKFPQYEDISKLIDIFEDLINSENQINLLIHCHAGISRSTAAAYILMYMLYKDKQKALTALIGARRVASPNLLILKYADEIFGTDLTPFIREYNDRKFKEREDSILLF